MCVKNEAKKLPWILEYHRRIGISRFFVVDNDSTDGTAEYLLGNKDVHLFWTKESYAQSKCGMEWINTLLNEFAIDHWTLTIDADEMLVYPKCETVNLLELTSFLESRQAQAMVTMLLDMYSHKAVNETELVPGESFLKECSYFDGDSYERRGPSKIYKPFRLYGGVRKRLFWDRSKDDSYAPFLGKIPLVKWRKDIAFESSTHVIRNVSLIDITGALLHFKFFSDFHEKAKAEAKRKEHWRDAYEYTVYLEAFEKTNNLTPFYEGSVKYTNSMQLVNLGFMVVPDDYYEFTQNLLA